MHETARDPCKVSREPAWPGTRLRMKARSFREIGRDLGISQIAAWKLWQQTFEDMVEQGDAEQEGRLLLIEAYRKWDEGDPEPFRMIFK
jgi:hypothetical protein